MSGWTRLLIAATACRRRGLSLYRDDDAAQLAVAVVNEVLPGGWLEFLGALSSLLMRRLTMPRSGGSRPRLPLTTLYDFLRMLMMKTSLTVPETRVLV